jgi:acetyltransferase-like isoleucine patch superfamily enzyme
LCILGKVYIRNNNIKIGKNVSLYPGVTLQGEGEIFIGDNTFLGNNTIIYSEKGYSVYIGNDCMIAAMCHIINTDHMMKIGEKMNLQGTDSKNIMIDDDVWLSSNVTILKGSFIETGAVIGAKSMVNGHVESNSIYVGIPGRKLRMRN